MCVFCGGSGECNKSGMCKECETELNKMNMIACREITVELAHFLPGHVKCGSVHGHSAKITLGVSGRVDPETGMLMDFSEIKDLMEKHIMEKFDHSYLNDYFSIPTSEVLAFYIYKALSPFLSIDFVKVYETQNNYVELRGK